MGLDTSHGAFHGAYSAFNRLRQAVAEATGGSFPPRKDKNLDQSQCYFGDDYDPATHPGLMEFLSHSDCDGEISPEMCQKVADDLEALLPVLDKRTDTGGHLRGYPRYGDVTRAFIAGCRAAAKANEPLEFH